MKQLTTNFFNLSPDPLAVISFDGVFLELNSAWKKKLGWSAEELKGTTLFNCIHLDDRVETREAFQKLLTENVTTKFEAWFRHKSEGRRYLFCSIVIDVEKQTIIFSGRDKTEQEHTRETLVNSQRQLEGVFSSLYEGVVAQDSNGQVVHYNQAALNLLKVSADQLLGKKTFDADWSMVDANGKPLGPDDHPAMISQRTGVAQINTIMGFRRGDGAIRWVSVSSKPIFRDHSLVPYQVVISFHDVTEEKNSREALVAKETEMTRVMNTMPALIAYWDRDGYNVFSNDRYCAIRNLKPADIAGKHIRETIGPLLWNQASEYIESALRGVPQNYEIQVPFFNGEVRTLVTTYLPEFRDGEVQGFFSVSTDITRIKTLEVERRDFESKLVAASKMSALGEMAAGIAHEINNPLAIINGKTSLLQTRIEKGLNNQEKALADLEMITLTVERIAKTVRGLLSFSRNVDVETMHPTNIQKVVDGTLDLCREKMKNRGIELRLELGEPLDIECRSNQISQILMNLLNNAYDAIANAPEQWIAVQVEKIDERVRICVLDSGLRISPAVADKLMNPFFTTKEVGKGTGLGLSISRGLAESHGGSLTYDKKASNTCFILELPLCTDPEALARKVA